jgi:hypothetical protein
MMRGTFPAALCGRTQNSLSMTVGIPSLQVHLHGRSARCEDVQITSDTTIVDLCRALLAAEVPDCALIITWSDRKPAGFVESFYAAATARAP